MNKQDKANFLLLALKACDAKGYSFYSIGQIDDQWDNEGWSFSMDDSGVTVWGEDAEGHSNIDMITFTGDELFPEPKWKKTSYGRFCFDFCTDPSFLKFIVDNSDEEKEYKLTIADTEFVEEISLPITDSKDAKHLARLIIEALRKEERKKKQVDW